MFEEMVRALDEALQRSARTVVLQKESAYSANQWSGTIDGHKISVIFQQGMVGSSYHRRPSGKFYCTLDVGCGLKTMAYHRPPTGWDYDRLVGHILKRVDRARTVHLAQQAERTVWLQAERACKALEEKYDTPWNVRVQGNTDGSLSLRLDNIPAQRMDTILAAIRPLLDPVKPADKPSGD